MSSKLLDQNLKALLDAEVAKRARVDELNEYRLDPIMVAREHNDEFVSLICALFAYGNVKQIVKFLKSLDFRLLDSDEELIKERLKSHYYRFQTSSDVIAIFIALSRLKKISTLENIFVEAYKKEHSCIDGINALIKTISDIYTHSSSGYRFLLSNITTKTRGSGALKRWMMFLRWMVRSDSIDMGLWSGVDKKDLIIPLDTHTFNVSKRLGLLDRKSYDLQSAIELTKALKRFDESDPLKYDFAIYRIGQERLL